MREPRWLAAVAVPTAYLSGAGHGKTLVPPKIFASWPRVCRSVFAMSVHQDVVLAPITAADRAEAAHFLHAELNSRVSVAAWQSAMDVPWHSDAPNHGFLLRSETHGVVGVYLAFYSERDHGEGTVRICNLGAWCVREDYREHSLRLLRAMLAQKGFEFTDLSPSGNVIPLNTRLKFQRLDTSTALAPNLPWIPSRSVRVVSDRAEIGRILTGRELQIFRDHERAAAARHLVLQRGEESCYVIFRKDRRKKLPLFASILYVSNPELFSATGRHAFRHLLLKHGALATLAEHRVTGRCPGPSTELRHPRTKMFKGEKLRPENVDYLYSELTCIAW